jgi:hypothetical protein
LFLAIDARVGSQWGGDNDAADDVFSDSYRAGEAVLDSDSVVVRANSMFQPICAAITVGDEEGFVMRVGSTGVLEVFRLGRRIFLVEGSYGHTKMTEIATSSGTPIVVPAAPSYMEYVASPPGAEAINIGSLDAKSGWLLLLPTIASAVGTTDVIATAKTPAVSFQTESMKDKDLLGLLLRVSPGKYRIAIEPELDLDFGLAARAIIDPA